MMEIILWLLCGVIAVLIYLFPNLGEQSRNGIRPAPSMRTGEDTGDFEQLQQTLATLETYEQIRILAVNRIDDC